MPTQMIFSGAEDRDQHLQVAKLMIRLAGSGLAGLPDGIATQHVEQCGVFGGKLAADIDKALVGHGAVAGTAVHAETGEAKGHWRAK